MISICLKAKLGEISNIDFLTATFMNIFLFQAPYHAENEDNYYVKFVSVGCDPILAEIVQDINPAADATVINSAPNRNYEM